MDNNNNEFVDLTEQVKEMKREFQRQTMKVEELQEVLGLSRNKTMELVKRDDFPKIKIGRIYRIIISEVPGWLKDHIGMTITKEEL